MIKSHLKVIGLDFDGTLVDSNKIKDLAFEEIFSEWPEHLEFMMQWHLNRNNIDRREKFRYFVEKVLVHPENQQLIDRLILAPRDVIDVPISIQINHVVRVSRPRRRDELKHSQVVGAK